MGTHKTIKKFIPVNLYDVPGMESWLCDMAEKGLYLKKFGKAFAYFEKEEPQHIRYRLEPVGKGDIVPSDEVLEYFQLSGWDYVTNINRLFYIYMAKDNGVEEIHTDPVAQSYTFEILNHKLRNSTIVATAASLLAIGMILSIYLLNKQPVFLMVESQFVNHCIFFLLEVFIIIRGINDARNINKLLKQLKAGVPIIHKRNYKKGRILGISGYSLLLLAAVIIILLPFVQIRKGWNENLEEVRVQLPVIRLEDLEEAEGFKYYSEITYNGKSYDNHVFYDWNPVAPVKYRITQSGIVENMKWADNSGVYKPSLTIEYYKLSIPILAEPLMEDLIDRYIDPYENMTMEELHADGIGRGMLFTRNEMQCLFACQDNDVIYLRYHGYGSLKAKINEIAEILN